MSCLLLERPVRAVKTSMGTRATTETLVRYATPTVRSVTGSTPGAAYLRNLW